MKNFLYKFYFLLFLVFMFSSMELNAQSLSFNKESGIQIQKISTVNLGSINDKYLGHLEHKEAPPVSGAKHKAYLKELKNNIDVDYPKNNHVSPTLRSSVNPPELKESIKVKSVVLGTPLDNHLAMSGDFILTAGNFYMSIIDKTGSLYKKFTLKTFADAAGITSFAFDPRLAYDPVSDRYILVFLAGSNSNTSNIILAFSATNDPMEDWHVYSISGSPNDLNEWTDYPMISLSKSSLYLTINLIIDNGSWQEGFVESVIWQMDKEKAYSGESLELTKWDKIKFDGKPIRNLCPAESATEELYDDMYFLSNRNFSVENDSFFLVKLGADITDPSIEIEYCIADLKYGVPPNAAQKANLFATNDARVLEAFRLNDEIQFVGNTRNIYNNKAGIYHGIIADITDIESTVNLNHIIGDDFEIGYPGITYTGINDFDKDAIINFNHTSNTRNAGTSALYSVPSEGYSLIIETAMGKGAVNDGTPVVRWGDYSGSQRDYNNPTDVYVCGFVGTLSQQSAPYVAILSRPETPIGTVDHKSVPAVELNAFPNPVVERVHIDFEFPKNGQAVKAVLTDINGRYLGDIYQSDWHSFGKCQFSFNMETLSSGSYFVQLFVDGNLISSEKLVKQ